MYIHIHSSPTLVDNMNLIMINNNKNNNERSPLTQKWLIIFLNQIELVKKNKK